MASQRTHREFAPGIAAGKVPVPWGRECQREIARRGLFMRGEASSRVSMASHSRSQQHRHTMSVVHAPAESMGSRSPSQPHWHIMGVQRNADPMGFMPALHHM